jgi:hypothetical protein
MLKRRLGRLGHNRHRVLWVAIVTSLLCTSAGLGGSALSSLEIAPLHGTAPTTAPSRVATVDQLAEVTAARSTSAFAGTAGGRRPTSASADLVESVRGQLELFGRPYHFFGVNAYELATDWGVNAGCGAMLSDEQLDNFFASLPPNSLVRFWAFQGNIATNFTTHQLDFAPIDRVVNAAIAYGQRLIFVLGGQGNMCDGGHWQDPSWYSGGFDQVFNTASNSNGRGLDPLSFWKYLRTIVTRYRDSPAVGMWEPMSEAEASTCPPQFQPTKCEGHQTCPDEHAAAVALRHFFDVVGGEIHRLDPNHLVESGLLGSGQCGTSGSDYDYVSASSGLDVLSVHDYYPADQPLGGDQWNGLAVRFQTAAQLGKPIIVGELGIEADADGSVSCPSLTARARAIRTKVAAILAHGSSGALVWDWEPKRYQSTCSLDTYPGDPLLHLLDLETHPQPLG